MFRGEAKPLGWWQLNADTLAGSRFVISPLAEAIASLIAADRGDRQHIRVSRPGWTRTGPPTGGGWPPTR